MQDGNTVGEAKEKIEVRKKKEENMFWNVKSRAVGSYDEDGEEESEGVKKRGQGEES